jgi:hypothetical protein
MPTSDFVLLMLKNAPPQYKRYFLLIFSEKMAFILGGELFEP